MADTFDIRFDRSQGLAAWFEAPSNAFRWKGAGRLSIDAQGVDVVASRGLLSLMSGNRSRRIPTANLKQVYREGDALRVEFATDKAPRESLRFWARDSDTAARIVALLPTRRTVELEHDPSNKRFRLHWWALILLAAAFAILAIAVSTFSDRSLTGVTSAPELRLSNLDTTHTTGKVVAPTFRQPASVTPSASRPEAATNDLGGRPRIREIVIPIYTGQSPRTAAPRGTIAPASQAVAPPESIDDKQIAPPSVPAQLEPARVFRVYASSEGVVPIVMGMASYEAARAELDIFIAASGLATNEDAWWAITEEIVANPSFRNPDLWPLRDMELAVSRAWRSYYRNPSAAEREFADRLSTIVVDYVN